ncbi:MAG: hypothetical protein GC179_31400 [Anaerolineaceae bacterium]|nr:hypothetical protein [Anaerolineaceae bacterium]
MVLSSVSTSPQTLSLIGEWEFALDPQDIGLEGGWINGELQNHIQVPASWAEAGFGEPPPSHFLAGWNPVLVYEGAAWYSRLLDVPDSWANQIVELVLSGVRWRSTVWLDGVQIGQAESLSVAHRYDLTDSIKPATQQRLTIRVDNRMLYPLDESHANSEQTATHWGGITGGAEIIVLPQRNIRSVKCRPDVNARTFYFDIALHHAEGTQLEVSVTNPETQKVCNNRLTIEDNHASVSVELGSDARLWWDDDPFLYNLTVTLKKDDKVIHQLEKRVGLREISTQGKQILLNGKPVFLRGYVDCCIFPLTGYTSWDIEHYRRQFRIARSYGFNHVRLHSWTAPEPFWQAADELGMLVQSELPHWSKFYTDSAVQPPEAVHHYLLRELELIVEALNLHPSWVMFSNGNELIGADGHPALTALSKHGKSLDSTRLFTDQTGFGQLPAPARNVDYYIQSCNWHPPKKIYDAASNDTTQDFSAVTAFSDRPVIGHEHGQFTMYVRPAEAGKYTGAIRPSWLESIEANFDTKGITSRVDEYIHASGIHMVRTYKENIERARRSRGLAGIQLLDIRDFPGQGHATTGILDMFWDSKDLIEPAAFAAFNDSVVMLMRSPAPTFWNNQPIEVEIEVSNFGREAIVNEKLHWELVGENNVTYRSGDLSIASAPVGEITSLGRLSIPVDADGAHAWELRVSIGTISNSWHLWTYPYPQVENDNFSVSTRIKELRSALPQANFSDNYGGTFLRIDYAQHLLNADLDLAISDRLSLRLLQYLHDGGRVWLMPNASQIYDHVQTRYIAPFWSYLHFPDSMSFVMGTIARPHPALAGFPHDGLADWQWYNLVNETPAIGLDSVPFIKPIVEVVDNFNRAKHLAYAFEANVGAGRLFVSTWRLYDPVVNGRPEARHLLSTILRYLQSDDFAPVEHLSSGQLLGLFKLTNVRALNLE